MSYKTLIIAAALGLSFASASEAKKLYKFQDAQGNWHFSDRPPSGTGIQVETQQLRITRRTTKVGLRRRGSSDDSSFHIINEYRGPIEFELALAESHNITASPALPKTFIVPGASEIRAVTVRPVNKAYGWVYRPRYRYMLGDPKAEHRPSKPYRVPFASHETFFISQAFHGHFSHTEPQSAYAVDIAMPEGTAVHAARAGRVMDVANDFFGAGTDDKYKSRSNLIRILHEDGTMGVYGHLRLESALVSPGMLVKRGQMIARSGNTGYSTGPHLHFVIQRNAGMRLVSVPFEFEGANGKGFTPEAQTWLKVHR